MLRRVCRYVGVIGCACALTSAAYADGIIGARDQDITFHVAKGPRTFVNMESKAPAETIKGVAKVMQGELTLNPAKLDKATGKFTVPFKNLDLSNSKGKGEPKPNPGMHGHMLGPEWIDADKNPDATFTVTGIDDVKAKKSGATAVLKGKMSIHGVEKDVSIPATLAYVQNKDTADKDTLSIKAEFEIKLADYEIKGRAGSIGHSVADALKMNVNVSMKAGEEKKSASDKAKPPAAKPRPPARIQ